MLSSAITRRSQVWNSGHLSRRGCPFRACLPASSLPPPWRRGARLDQPRPGADRLRRAARGDRPGSSPKGVGRRVAGTGMTAQQAADAAIEDVKHPELVPLPETAFRGRSRATAPTRPARRGAGGTARARGGARAPRGGRPRRAAARAAWGEAFDAGCRRRRVRRARRPRRASPARSTPRARPWTCAPPRCAPPRRARRSRARSAEAELAPLDYAIRAHEILEDVQRDRWATRAACGATADGVAATRES